MHICLNIQRISHFNGKSYPHWFNTQPKIVIKMYDYIVLSIFLTYVKHWLTVYYIFKIFDTNIIDFKA